MIYRYIHIYTDTYIYIYIHICVRTSITTFLTDNNMSPRARTAAVSERVAGHRGPRAAKIIIIIIIIIISIYIYIYIYIYKRRLELGSSRAGRRQSPKAKPRMADSPVGQPPRATLAAYASLLHRTLFCRSMAYSMPFHRHERLKPRLVWQPRAAESLPPAVLRDGQYYSIV